MAGRGVKRPVALQGVSEVKRLDTNSHEGMVQLVVNAVDKAIELDDSSRVMLRNMAPLCLHAPIGDRHEYQVTVGEMLRQALAQAEAAVYTAIKDAEDAAVQAAATANRLKQETEARRERLAAELKALSSAKQAWCEVQQALRADWRRLSEARNERRSLDANLIEALQKKEKLEAAIESHFGAIVEGREIATNVEALVLASRAAGLDTGLVDSFDLVARKRPESRTPFEKIVLNEVKTAAASRAAELAGIAERGNPGTAERVAAEAAAGAAFSAAEERMSEAARHLRRTEVNVQVAEADALDAEEAEEEADHEKRHRASDHVIAQWSHEQFRHGPLTVFQKLHGRAVLTEALEAARRRPEPPAEAVQVTATADEPAMEVEVAAEGATAEAVPVVATADEPAMEVEVAAEGANAEAVPVVATADEISMEVAATAAEVVQVEPEEAPAEQAVEALDEPMVLLPLQESSAREMEILPIAAYLDANLRSAELPGSLAGRLFPTQDKATETSQESPKDCAREVQILPITAYYEAYLRTSELPGNIAGRLFPTQNKAAAGALAPEEPAEEIMESSKEEVAAEAVVAEEPEEEIMESSKQEAAAEAVVAEEPVEEIMEASKEEAKPELMEEGAREETAMEAQEEAVEGVEEACKGKVEAASAEATLESPTETSEGRPQAVQTARRWLGLLKKRLSRVAEPEHGDIVAEEMVQTSEDQAVAGEELEAMHAQEDVEHIAKAAVSEEAAEEVGDEAAVETMAEAKLAVTEEVVQEAAQEAAGETLEDTETKSEASEQEVVQESEEKPDLVAMEEVKEAAQEIVEEGKDSSDAREREAVEEPEEKSEVGATDAIEEAAHEVSEEDEEIHKPEEVEEALVKESEEKPELSATEAADETAGATEQGAETAETRADDPMEMSEEETVLPLATEATEATEAPEEMAEVSEEQPEAAEKEPDATEELEATEEAPEAAEEDKSEAAEEHKSEAAEEQPMEASEEMLEAAPLEDPADEPVTDEVHAVDEKAVAEPEGTSEEEQAENIAEDPEAEAMNKKVELEQIPEAVVAVELAEGVIEAPEDVSNAVKEEAPEDDAERRWDMADQGAYTIGDFETEYGEAAQAKWEASAVYVEGQSFEDATAHLEKAPAQDEADAIEEDAKSDAEVEEAAEEVVEKAGEESDADSDSKPEAVAEADSDADSNSKPEAVEEEDAAREPAEASPDSATAPVSEEKVGDNDGSSGEEDVAQEKRKCDEMAVSEEDADVEEDIQSKRQRLGEVCPEDHEASQDSHGEQNKQHTEALEEVEDAEEPAEVASSKRRRLKASSSDGEDRRSPSCDALASPSPIEAVAKPVRAASASPRGSVPEGASCEEMAAELDC